MRNLVSAIAAAFRAMGTAVTTVYRYCRDTGKWIAETVVKTVGSLGGGGSAGSEEVPEPVEPARSVEQILADANALVAETVVPPAAGGDGYDVIQRVCQAINIDEEPAAVDLKELSPLQLEWINLMRPDMRFVVGNCRKQDLVEHVRGRKGMKGIIPCDAGSLKDWRDALARENDGIRPWFSMSAPVDGDEPVLQYAV